MSLLTPDKIEDRTDPCQWYRFFTNCIDNYPESGFYSFLSLYLPRWTGTKDQLFTLKIPKQKAVAHTKCVFVATCMTFNQEMYACFALALWKKER